MIPITTSTNHDHFTNKHHHRKGAVSKCCKNWRQQMKVAGCQAIAVRWRWRINLDEEFAIATRESDQTSVSCLAPVKTVLV